MPRKAVGVTMTRTSSIVSGAPVRRVAKSGRIESVVMYALAATPPMSSMPPIGTAPTAHLHGGRKSGPVGEERALDAGDPRRGAGCLRVDRGVDRVM